MPVAQVKLRPPLPKPVNVDCMAVNYMEDGTRKAPAPINAFHKSPGCIVGHGDTMVLPDIAATIFEGEAELAVVIGKRASNVPAAKAMEYVFGYVNFIDGSARGVLPPGNTFYQMKSRASFAPIGPYLVTADEIRDPHKLQVRLWVNGVLKQNFNTDDMANKIPRCIEWITSIHDLEPGDILATGTNHRGLSAFQDGDTVELEIEGLGRLTIKSARRAEAHVGARDALEREAERLEGHDAAADRQVRPCLVERGLRRRPPEPDSRGGSVCDYLVVDFAPAIVLTSPVSSPPSSMRMLP